jgi:hypothetical protein
VSAVVAGLEVMEPGEGLPELVAGDVLILDVDLVEDRLVEHAALFVVAAQVEGLGVLQKLEADFDEAGAVGQVCGGLVQAAGEVLALAFDLAQLGVNLGCGVGEAAGGGGQVDQIAFLDV